MPAGPADGRVEAERRALTPPSTASQLRRDGRLQVLQPGGEM